MTEVERALEELADVRVSDETRLATEEQMWVGALLHDIAYGTPKEREVARIWLRWHDEQVLLGHGRDGAGRSAVGQAHAGSPSCPLGRLVSSVGTLARRAGDKVCGVLGDILRRS